MVGRRVSVGVRVKVGVFEAVGLGPGVIVSVGVCVAVSVGVAEVTSVGVSVAGSGEGVSVGGSVGEGVNVWVMVGTAVAVKRLANAPCPPQPVRVKARSPKIPAKNAKFLFRRSMITFLRPLRGSGSTVRRLH